MPLADFLSPPSRISGSRLCFSIFLRLYLKVSFRRYFVAPPAVKILKFLLQKENPRCSAGFTVKGTSRIQITGSYDSQAKATKNLCAKFCSFFYVLNELKSKPGGGVPCFPTTLLYTSPLPVPVQIVSLHKILTKKLTWYRYLTFDINFYS